MIIASKPRSLINRQVSFAASRYFYIIVFKGGGGYLAVESDLGICVMVEILNKAFNKPEKTLETAKDNLKDRVAFLLGCRLTNRGEFDELDYRDDETTERD